MPLIPVLEWATDFAANSARFGRADVGLVRALAHGDADAGAGEIDAAAGNHLALLDQTIDRLRGQDGEVAAGAGFEFLQQAVRRTPGDHHFRADGALEIGGKIEHHGLEAVGAEHSHRSVPFAFPSGF
jgi:hypothetical protein